MFQKSFVRFKNGYVVTFDTLIVENVYQSPSNSPEEEAPSQPPPKGEEKNNQADPLHFAIIVTKGYG